MKSKLFFLVFFVFLFWELLFKGFVAAPVDTLVGAYYPWVSYKWGYSTGVPVKNALLSDVFDQFFIWKHYTAKFLFSGHIPAWNPYSFSGTPFIATFHSAVFHPGNIVFLLPLPWGWNAYIMLATVSSMLAMYIFLRGHATSRGALLGSLVFALAGPMSTWSEFGTAVWAMAIIPLLLRCIDRNATKWLPPLWACLVLAGNVQVIIYASVITLLYAWCTKSFFLAWKTAIAVLVGFGLTAIQLLPTAELFSRSIRSGEKYASLFNFGLNDISQSIRFIAPDIFGHPSTNNFSSTFAYHDFTGFFGTIGFILVVSLVLYYIRHKAPTRTLRFFIWTWIVSLALSVDWPVSRFLFGQQIPLLTYSLASRIYFVTALSAGVLIAASEQIFFRRSYRITLALVSICAGIYVITTYLFLPAIQQSIATRNVMIPSMFIAITAGTSVVGQSKKIRPLLFWMIIFATAADLGRYYKKYNPFAPARLVYPPTQTTDFLKNHSDFAFVSLSSDVLPPNTWMWYEIRSFEGYDPLYFLSFNRYFQGANSQTIYGTPGRFVDITNPNLPKLRRANVGYYAIKSTDTVPPQIANFPIVFSAEGITIYEDPEAMPFAYEPLPEVGVIATNFDSGWRVRYHGENLQTFMFDETLLGIRLPKSVSIQDVQIDYRPLSLLIGAGLSACTLLLYLLWIKR